MWSARIPLLIFVITLCVYLRTIAPTVYNLDSAELAIGAYTLGIVHPPGYPTYLLLGKLFSLLPVGDVGYRLNLMSGFFGALTVLLVYLICRRLSCSTSASMTASFLLAFSYFFWTSSVVAEVYTLHSAFIASLFGVLLLWRERQNANLLLVGAFLYGLSFGAHSSSVLLSPGIALFMHLHRNQQNLSLRHGLGVLCCFLLGLAVFVYLPLRYAGGALNLTGGFDAWGGYHTADLTNWHGLRWFVSGELFRPMMFAYDWVGLGHEALRYLGWLWGTFAGVGIVLGILGFAEWLRTRPKDAFVSAFLFFGPLGFFLNYAALDKETMFLSTYVIWALWVGSGCEILLRELRSAFQVTARTRRIALSLHGVLLALPLFAFALNYQYADISRDRRSRDWATELLTIVEPNAVVLGWWADIQPMVYLQQVENVRSDVFILSRMGISPNELSDFLALRIQTGPVYSANFDSWLASYYDFQPQQRGYRLLPRTVSY